jgi:hypothetical protein
MYGCELLTIVHSCPKLGYVVHVQDNEGPNSWGFFPYGFHAWTANT